MSHWLDAAKIFEENSKEGNYFEAQSGINALKRIQTFLETTFPQMFFLLGEPGSGKSFMLHHLYRLYAPKRLCVLIENPFLSPEQLLERLLVCRGVDKGYGDLEDLRIRAIEAYRGVEHLIMLDEGQLLSPSMREFIRILSDSKVFYFLIAMHKDEGEEMLLSPHFRSRPHQVVYLQDLELDECMPYLIKELKPLKKINTRELFSKSLVNKSWSYSQGNFRNFKKCYYHLFLLLDYAHNHNKKDFLKPNMTLLRMAAMRSKLLASQVSGFDFEQLLKEAKKDKTFSISLGLGALLIIAALLSWWTLDKALNPKDTKSSFISKEEEFVPTKEIIEVKSKEEELKEELEEELEKELKEELEEELSASLDEETNQNQEKIVEEAQKSEHENIILEEDNISKSYDAPLLDSNKDKTPSLVEDETNKEEALDANIIKEALPLKTPHLPMPENPTKRIYVKPYQN